MVIGSVLINITEIISALPPNIADRLGTLITILKAVGIIFVVYFTYLIVNGIINWKGSRRLKFIEKKVKIIEKKLDLLLKGRKKEKKK